MRHTSRIFSYQFKSLLRSRWLYGMSLLLLVVTEVVFRFGSDPGKAVASLMNVVLIIVPLISVVLGTVYFYNAREFNELLLAQPLARSSVYIGTLAGLAGALSLAFLVGAGAPFLLHGYQLAAYAGKVLTLFSVGVSLIIVFSALAFCAAARFDDRIRGLGATLLVWFLLAVVWDGVVLLFVYAFREYPYEPGLLSLVFLNPIDLGRILILLQLDIAALMGYTGAVFQKVFDGGNGVALACVAMVVYALVPVLYGLHVFRRRDL
jgi:Cu-processing system permease protein